MDTVLAGKAVPEYIYLIRSKIHMFGHHPITSPATHSKRETLLAAQEPGHFLSFFLHVSLAKMTVLAPRDRTAILERSS